MITTAIVAVGLTLGSMHSKPGFNGVNPGAYAVLDSGYVAGAYHNSHERLSVFAAKQFETRLNSSVRVGVLAGGVTGYGDTLTPLVSANVALDAGPVTWRLSFVPAHPTKPNAASALLLAVEIKR